MSKEIEADLRQRGLTSVAEYWRGGRTAPAYRSWIGPRELSTPIPLVYDLMDPLHPNIDRAVLEFALSHTSSLGYFSINRWGGCS